MISMDELLMDRAKLEDLPQDIQDNLNLLHERINKLREVYGKPLKVNDGYRRAEDKPKNGATKSNHYTGLAVDLDDDDNPAWLWAWVLNNLALMQEIGLWMEDPRWTHKNGSWMHFQVIPPSSGHRIYIPSSAPASAPDLWDGKYDAKYNDIP